MDNVLLKSILNRTELMIILQNRKVYIGYVTKAAEPTADSGFDQEIEIYPRTSGYREKDTLDVKLITSYDLSENIRITIKQSLIESVSVFNRKAFNNHMKLNKAMEKHKSLQESNKH